MLCVLAVLLVLAAASPRRRIVHPVMVYPLQYVAVCCAAPLPDGYLR